MDAETAADPGTDSARRWWESGPVRAFLAMLPGTVSVLDRQGTVIFSSRTFTGRPASEVAGSSVLDHVDPSAHGRLRRALERLFERGESVEEDLPGPGGRTLRCRLAPWSEDGAVAFALAVSHDVTAERRRQAGQRSLEDRLRRKQKLESLGVLAGGIAHDFNNLLQTVMGNAGFLQADLPADSPLQESVGKILEASRTMAGISRQMLAYAGEGRFFVEQLHLSHVVKEVLPMVEAFRSRKVQVRTRLARDLSLVEADRGQMRQVVLNLVTNACEAAAEAGGEVAVSTAAGALEPGAAEAALFPDARPGPCVILTVSDTGPGMAPEVLERACEPFFSTRATGRGMGLPAVFGVVRSQGGVLRLASGPGRGVRATVLLPVEHAPAPEEEAFVPPLGWRGAGRILVVDDEEDILELVRTVLCGAGFEVETARNGREALDRIGGRPGRYAAVVLDVAMPVMDGAETCAALEAMENPPPVVAASGYTEEQARRRLASPVVKAVASKPFSSGRLLEVLRGVLESGPEPEGRGGT